MKARLFQSLFLSVAAGFSAAALSADAGTLVRGVDYEEIQGGTPLHTQDGRVEVAEVFNYACPACNAFEPLMEAWRSTLPEYVHVVYVPAQFRPDFVPYAKAYYAAESLGIAESSHAAVYQAIHGSETLPGEGDKIDEARVAAFYTQFGADADDFLKRMNGFAVNGQLRKADRFMRESRVMQTPSLVIDGRYLLKARSWETLLKNASTLIEQQRAARDAAS